MALKYSKIVNRVLIQYQKKKKKTSIVLVLEKYLNIMVWFILKKIVK